MALLFFVISLFTFFYIFEDWSFPGKSSVYTQPNYNELIVIDTPSIEPEKLEWRLATSSASWGARDSSASFVFSNKIWIMGGLNAENVIAENGKVHYWEAPHYNDIWSSSDGASWTLEKKYANWSVRRSMSVILFEDKLWMYGGWSPITGYSSEIWQSDDGINWNRVGKNAEWPPREGQSMEVFNGKMWLFGGVNYDSRLTMNDVWQSDDGINWKKVDVHIPWSSRWDHATAVFKGQIYLLGGMDLNNRTFNDIWSTSDGIIWKKVIENPPWQKRQGHSLINFKDRIWLIGVLNSTVEGGINDIWFSDNGVDWKRTEVNAPWTNREDHSTQVLGDNIIVFGGMDSNLKWRNDVWFSSYQYEKSF